MRRSGRGYEKDSSDQTVAALEELASRPEVRFRALEVLTGLEVSTPRAGEVLTGLEPEVRFRALEVLTGLEDYCAEPDFTNAVTDFFLAESAVFDDREEDFPLEWYTSFQKYGVLLESLLNGFVRDEGSETRDVEEESRITCSHEELEFVCQMFLRQLEADNNPLTIAGCTSGMIVTVALMIFGKMKIIFPHKPQVKVKTPKTAAC
eukprot:g18313.t1